MLLKNRFLFVAFIFSAFSLAQKKPQSIKTFTQKDLNAYQFDENKYDLRTKKSFYLRTEADTASYFWDPSKYKGILNYGVDFAARDKRTFTFIENYFVYYTDVVFEKCTISLTDSIAQIEGQIVGGWNSADFRGKPPMDVVEISVGELQKKSFVFDLEIFNPDGIITTYQGQEKKHDFPLDTISSMVFQKLSFRKSYPTATPFKVRFKVDRNSILSIGKLDCYAHFYNLGEMMYAKQRKKGVTLPKRSADAPRFAKIIENNVQVNDPKSQIKKEVPPYYQLTEKAETYILTRQYAKAKETYALLAKENPTLFARDIHNAIRVAILSRDVKTAFWWGEKLAAKGVDLPYFKAKIFDGMRKNPGWKAFEAKYDSIGKVSKSRWNTSLKQQLTDLLNEDQTDYGLENRKESVVLYETTERVTDKFIDLLRKEGYPSEEKIGALTRNDTTLVQSPDFTVVIRHAIQQKPKNLKLLNEILDKSYNALEFDSKRSTANRMFPNSCFHIYKGNLYNSKSCSYSNDVMVKKMVFMFNNPNQFILDNGDYIIAEYNKESPEEWDTYYENNFNLVMKLTDDWEFYEK